MRFGFRVQVIVLVSLLLAADRATAQPLVYTAESLESLIINSDRVWVATIVGVREDPIPGGSSKPGITIAVEETLKYPLFEQRHPKMGLFIEKPIDRFKDLEERSSRVLIAHSDHRQFSPTLIDLTPGKVEVFTAGFKILRDSDAVIRKAKEIIRRTPANVRELHTVRLMIPPELLAKSTHGPFGQLVVPVDDELEKQAIRFLKSQSYSRRSEAAKVLRYFKSDANIARLRPLLEDSEFSQRQTGNRNRAKYHGVRDAAYQTLNAWGIEVERPVILEPDSRQDE